MKTTFGRIFGAAILFAVACLHAAPAKKMNVLFIMSDDLRVALGTYNDRAAKTPNLDKFAKSSVRFEHAYCQYPLCNPSRASLMTGRRPDTTTVYGNGVHFRSVLPDVVTLPQLFKNNGYFSARVGKIYHYGVPGQIGTSGLDDAPSWNQVINPSGHDKVVEPKIFDYVPSNHNIGGSLTWYDDEESADEEQTDGKVADETIRLLEQHKNEPFFIACGFYRPHVPCIAPDKYFKMFPVDKVKLPQERPEHLKNIPEQAFHVRPPNYGLEEEKLRLMRRAYYASVSFMDAQFGRVVAALKKLKLEDNTIVVFISDHGWLLGEHGQWQKQMLFEYATHVPMMIYVPGGKGNGKTSVRTVELVDVYPTIAELCGLPAPTGFEGKSLTPLLENPKAEWSNAAFTQVTSHGRNGRSVRTERWRYTEWDSGKAGSELYDYESDPNELKNLANDSNYAATRTEMKKLLDLHPVVAVSEEKASARRKKAAK